MPGKRASFSFVESESGSRLLASVSDAPIKVKPTVKEIPLSRPNGDMILQQEIEDHGDEIRTALMDHPEIAKVLSQIDLAPNAENWNLLFGISSPFGEAVRWEVLRNAVPDHLALSLGRRLFRIAADPASPELGIRHFPDRLRFVAVLSPAGVPCRPEFDALVAAAERGRTAGLPLDLLMYVGDRDLLQIAPDWATCKLMPASTTELQDELRAARGHLVHFFCHGQSEFPQALQFATVAEQRAKESEGSVLLSMDRIVEAHLIDAAWLVVFNCCDGGRPGKALGSMAYRAVAEAGVPAAIGMGSPLPSGAAPLFSAALYGSLFKGLADIMPAVANSAVEVDFGEPIAEARCGLHQAITSSGVPFSCWSLPIIYLNRKQFIVQKTFGESLPAGRTDGPLPQPAPPDPLIIRKRIATIAGMLQSMPATTPRAVRQQMIQLFDEDPVVPPALRCDEYGAFPGSGDRQ